MTKAIAFGLALGLICTAAGACSKGDDDSAAGHDTRAKNDNAGSATETNVAPIHCFEDSDCATGQCELFPGQDDGTCSGGGNPGGPYRPGQGGDEDGGTISGPNTR
jgi:hypothetical protein